MSTNRAQRRRPPGRPARPVRAPRPLPEGDALFTPGASARRQAIERQSAAPLLWLHQIPVWLLPLLAVGLLVTGLAVHGWVGAVALCGVAVLLGWLAALSWPRLSAQGRLLRTAAIACVLLAAVIRAVSH
ncbi:MAG TPA: DUF6703 family protein [Streptosporangiaceae bacterium]|nr:DUF6703 family protein [Streptosporangiaceae bacterium]